MELTWRSYCGDSTRASSRELMRTGALVFGGGVFGSTATADAAAGVATPAFVGVSWPPTAVASAQQENK